MIETAKEALIRLVGILVDESRPTVALRPEILELQELLMAYSSLKCSRQENIAFGESSTGEGLAFSPTMAAMCVEDYVRTIVFLRGVHAAILKAEAAAEEKPVKVLYAGCGPLGTLAIPLMALFSSERCQFLFLDIRREALESARILVKSLDFTDSVVEFVEADATSYGISSNWKPDVVVSEIMQACLEAEPQVAIFRHLYHQAPEALFVPEEVRIDLVAVDSSREFALDGKSPVRDGIELGTVFALNKNALEAWGNAAVEYLQGATVSLPTGIFPVKTPLMFTRIQTFGDHILSNYDSGLSSPRTLDLEKGVLADGVELRFSYRLGEHPALVCKSESMVAAKKLSESGLNIPSFDRVWRELEAMGQGEWVARLQETVVRQYSGEGHGDLPRWLRVLERIRTFEGGGFEVREGELFFPASKSQESLKNALMGLSPWRKGPFRFGNVFVDTEWRSDWKWERLREKISPMEGRRILDVGCGNGYHLWRMLDEGARLALGIDPALLFGCQFLAARHFAGDELPIGVLPLGIEGVPEKMACFDTTFSMGVLYHRRSPIEHLEALRDTLVQEGELVLETLVVEGDENKVLLPEGRYAQMRNVWFLPSVKLLVRMMKRVGLRKVEVLDVTPTTTAEQRGTEWMKFNSLSDFLDPVDATRTIEGYPGPVRAVLRATR